MSITEQLLFRQMSTQSSCQRSFFFLPVREMICQFFVICCHLLSRTYSFIHAINKFSRECTGIYSPPESALVLSHIWIVQNLMESHSSCLMYISFSHSSSQPVGYRVRWCLLHTTDDRVASSAYIRGRIVCFSSCTEGIKVYYKISTNCFTFQ